MTQEGTPGHLLFKGAPGSPACCWPLQGGEIPAHSGGAGPPGWAAVGAGACWRAGSQTEQPGRLRTRHSQDLELQRKLT